MKEFEAEEYERILSFLEGETNEAEKKEMLSRLEADPDLAYEVQKVKETLSALRYNHVKSLVGPRQGADRYPAVPVISLRRHPRTWLAAAVVTALLVLGGRYLYQNYSNTGEETAGTGVPPEDTTRTDTPSLPNPQAESMANILIAENLNLNDIPPSLQKEASAIGVDIDRGQAISALENLEKSAPAVTQKPDEPLLGSSPDNPAEKKALSATEEAYRKLLLGIGYLKEGRSEEALRTLDRVKVPSLAQEVHWYKALALLKTGQNERARAELEKITDPRYRADAQDLLSNLP